MTTVPTTDLTTLDYTQLKELEGAVAKQLQLKQQQSDEAKIDELLKSKKGQSLIERWKQAKIAVDRYRTTQKVKVKMLLQVELEAEVYLDAYNFNNNCFDEGDLFQVEVSGNVLRTKGLKQNQISTLNYGLQETLNNACDDKMDLFPVLRDELDGIAEELQTIKDELDAYDLSVTDLDKYITPPAKKSKKK